MALCLHAQQAAGATATARVVTPTPSPVVSVTPSPVVSVTPTANQTGGGGADPTLVGAAIIGIIAVGLMIGFYYTTRRM
jgi:hypothetical protein